MMGLADPIHVLYVDDDADLRETVAAVLEGADDRIAVRTAASADRAWQPIDAHAIDCVVVGDGLARREGIDFIETIRERHPELPVILFAGVGSEELTRAAIAAGVTDYVLNTADGQFEMLAHRITTVLENRRSDHATDAAGRVAEIADHTDDLLFMVSADWSEILYVNDSYETVIGGSLEEIKAEPERFLERVHPADKPSVLDRMDTLRAGEPSENEYRIETPDGETRWVQGQSKPVVEDGEVDRVIGLIRDISERKEYEQRLQRRERRYNAVFNDPNILMGLLDTDGTVLEVNETAESYVGADAADITGRKLWESPWIRNSDVDREWVESRVETAAGGESVEFELALASDQQDSYTVEGVISPVSEEDGGVVSLLVSARDVTERVDSARKRQQIIDRMSDAVVEVDADWTITLANDRVEEFWDIEAASLVGREFWAVFSEAVDTRFEQEYRRAMASRELTSFVEYAPWVGEWFDIRIHPNADGGIAIYFTSITDHKRRQETLDRKNALLSILFKTLPVGVMVENEESEILTVNERFVELFEIPETPEEVVGTDREALANDIKPMIAAQEGFLERLSDISDAGHRVQREEVALKDGRTYTMSHEPVELRNSEGSLWVYDDVTERKDRERRYAAVFDNTYQFTGLLEPDGTLIEANETALEFGGVDRADVVGEKLWETDWCDHSAATREAVREAVERASEGEVVRTELTFQGSDREAIVDFSIRPVTDDRGRVTQLVPEGRDITDRKQRERELERANDHLSALYATAPMAITVVDTDGRLVRANERAEDVLGLTESEITERTYDDPEWAIVDEDGEPIPSEALPAARVFETGEPVYQYEHGVEWPDGTRRWLSINAAPVTDEDGDVERVVTAFRDVTESRQRGQQSIASPETVD